MELTGVYVPLITPFDSDGAVALDVLERLANEVLDAGARGLVALGSTGEPGALTPAEQKDVVNVVRRVVNDRHAGLIVGAQQATLDETALVLVPPFVRPGEEAVVRYFASLSRESGPIVIYHIPYRTGQRLGAETLLRLAALDNVVGIKYANGCIDEDTIAFMASVPADFAVLCGDDAYLTPMLALGAPGAIMASAHVCTADYVAHVDGAPGLGHRLARLSAGLFAEPNPTVVKAVLQAQGRIPDSRVRPPLLAAHQYTTEEVLRML